MTIQLFHKVEGAVAIVRYKGGIMKQTDVYARATRLFIPHAGGYLRITSGFGDEYGTINPDIKVLEIDGYSIDVSTREPRYTP